MIYFAGVPTLLPNDAIKPYVDSLLSEVFYDAAFGSELGGSAPSLPALNWSRSFRPRINQLIWPTGASRWASMYLLVDSVRLEEIITACHLYVPSGHVPQSAQLQICDSRFSGAPGTLTENAWTRGLNDSLLPGDYVGLSTAMYALEPRPLSLPFNWTGTTWEESTETTFWLLPIVDERWFWQWKNIGEPSDWGTWSEAFDAISESLGVSYPEVDSVHAEYGTPPTLNDLQYANSARLLDAMARLCGMRVTRDVDTKLSIRKASSAVDVYDQNTGNYPAESPNAVWQRIAGGLYHGETPRHKSAAVIPENIRFVFGDNETAVQSTKLAGALEWSELTEGVVFTGVTPESAAARTSYAERYVTDALKWMSRRLDVAFAGVKSWTTTGIEDFVEISHQPMPGNTPWQFATRVVSVCENLNPRERATAAGSGSRSIWFTVDESVCADAYAERHVLATPIWNASGCNSAVMGADPYTGQVAVYDICGEMAYFTDGDIIGKVGRATWMYPMNGSCEGQWIVDKICGESECG